MAEGDVIDQVTNFNVGQAVGGFVDASVGYLAWGAVGLILLGFILMKLREWKIYRYPVRAFRRREGNKVKEINYKGGYLIGKNKVREFWVKTGRMPWQATKMDRLPDAHFMDEDNRVYYNVVDPDTWIQVRRTFLEKQISKRKVRLLKSYAGFKVGQEGEAIEDVADELVKAGYAEYSDDGDIQSILVADALYEPIPSDTKEIVINKLQAARAALGNDTTKQVAIFTMGLIILAVMFLIAYYFLTNRPGT